MTVTIPGDFIPAMVVVFGIIVTWILAYFWLFSVEKRYAMRRVESMEDEKNRMVRERDVLAEKNRSLQAENSRLIDERAAASRHAEELKGRIAKAAVALGLSGPDEDNDDESEDDEPEEPKPVPAPQRYLYACSVISWHEDECDGDHTCLMIRAFSKDEASGVAHRISEDKYPDGYDIEWAGSPIEAQS